MESIHQAQQENLPLIQHAKQLRRVVVDGMDTFTADHQDVNLSQPTTNSLVTADGKTNVIKENIRYLEGLNVSEVRSVTMDLCSCRYHEVR